MSNRTDRRTLLATGAAGCALGLAGCTGLFDEPDDDERDDTAGNETDTGTENETEPDAGEPAETLEEWPSFQYDPQNSGHAPGSGPEAPLEVIWEYEAEEKFRGAPVITDGTAYAGCDDGHLYAFDLSEGTLEWRAPTRSRVRRPLAVADDLVLASMGDGIDAYDRHDGDRVWEFVPGDEASASAPVVEDGTVVVGSGEPAVYAIDLETGRQQWRQSHDINLVDPPAIDDGTVYACDTSNQVNVYQLDDGTPRYSARIDSKQFTGATVVDDVIYMGGDEGTFSALDATNLGDELWTFDANDTIRGSPIVGDDHVFVIDNEGIVYCLNRSEGDLVWSEELIRFGARNAALVDQTLYVGDGGGFVRGFDAGTGANQIFAEVSDRRLGTPALTEDVITIADNRDAFYALREN